MQDLLTTAIELVAIAPFILLALHLGYSELPAPVVEPTPTLSPEVEQQPQPVVKKTPTISYDSVWVKQEIKSNWLASIKRYKYGQLGQVVKVEDVPVEIPSTVKRYSFRGNPKSCVKVSDLERLAS